MTQTTPQETPDQGTVTQPPPKAASRPTGQKNAKKTKATATGKAAKKAPAKAGEGKGALIIAALSGKTGATMDELMTATGWAAHSVRGFISGVLRGKRGMSIERFARKDGAMAYRIMSGGK